MMLNEFRVGNLVYFVSEEHPVTIEGVSSRLRPDCGYFELSGIDTPQKGIHLKPIPLTEEWLLRLGFKQCSGKIANCFYEIPISNSTLAVNGGNNAGHGIVWVFNPVGEHAYNPPSIKYVHQLQNLYFALTGEELITT